MLKQSLFSLLFILLFASKTQAQTNTALSVYDFGLQNMEVPARIELLKSLGYKGIVFKINTLGELPILSKYLSSTAKEDDFNITSIYFPYRFNPNKNPNQVWKKVVDSIRGKNISLWVIFSGEPTRAEAIKKVQEMVEYCHSANVDFVFYPHDNTYIETAEESIELFKEAGVTGAYTSFHLCHEFRGGNKDRLEEALKTLKPYLKLVSISGADNQVNYEGKNGWSDTIKPLYEGDYNLSEFMSALKTVNFTGDIVLHTFGIKIAPETHLKGSMDKWKTLQ